MAVPRFYWFIDPVLRVLEESGGPLHRRDITQRAPRRMDLSAEDMRELSGEKGAARGITKVRDRTGWALSYAGKMGWVESVSRGMWCITRAGKELLASHPAGIPESVYEEMLAQIRAERRARKPSGGEGAGPEPDEDAATPDERIHAAYSELRGAVADALLTRVRSADPEFFEHLVLRLLKSMGYGSDDDPFEQTGGSGDGGIDGVISLDRLGLERVYVQAKRYGADNPVQRPAIQGFLGALTQKNANKGVFITSSRFSDGALRFVADRDGIVLIDGDMLANLMIDYEIGVTRSATIHLVEVDESYFEDGY